MPTNQLAVLANRQMYLGWTRQAAWQTPLAPTSFWRWLQGSEANPDARTVTEREGDGSFYESFSYKQGQWWVIKVVEYVRPITAGCAIAAALGSGSDTYTAPAGASVLSSPIVAGTNTFQTTASIGNVGASVGVNFSPGIASTVYEVQPVNLAGRTGTGPYTYTLAGSAAFQYAHPGADVVNTAATHAMTRTNVYDPYSIEVGYGATGIAPNLAYRVQDCICHELTIEADKGRPVKMTHMWYGTIGKPQAGLAAPVFEGTGLTNNAGRPMLFYDAGTSWRVNNSAVGNAVTIEKLKITIKNSTMPEDLQNELLTPSYFMPGNVEISGELVAHFTTFADYNLTYYGSTSPAVGTPDSFLVGYSQLGTTFATDTVNALALSLGSVEYTAAKLAPSLDAKPLLQPIMFKAIKSPANPVPFTATLTNSQASAYS